MPILGAAPVLVWEEELKFPASIYLLIGFLQFSCIAVCTEHLTIHCLRIRAIKFLFL